MVPEVDVVVLSRDRNPLRAEVAQGIAGQTGVRIRVHRLVTQPRPSEPNRWATIARARNAGKQMGRAPWIMFLDDDVQLASGTVQQLLDALQRQPAYGALAADYLGESRGGGPTGHVAMGATLFRRAALERIEFRWEPDRCECQCCCDDLRQQGLGIAYSPTARALHLKTSASPDHATTCRHCNGVASHAASLSGRILAAFDRRHYPKFRKIFLPSFRAAGNHEWVTAVAYGLYPSEVHVLGAMYRVEVLAYPANNASPAVRRLREFPVALERWDPDTPVAYWDAGDVMFQGRIAPLWEMVRANPDKLLAVKEPKTYPHIDVIKHWTKTIRHPVARRRALELLSAHPFLNSGFCAGTARALVAYMKKGDEMVGSFTLEGSTDWGDQTAFNIYCHTHPALWMAIDEGWNYCMHGRDPRQFRIRAGNVFSTRGNPVHVVHGNAHSFRHHELAVI